MGESMALPIVKGSVFSNRRCDTYVQSEKPFKVSGVFSSHMVLQRDKPIAIFGFSSKAGAVIRGEFDGEEAITTVNSENEWKLCFGQRTFCREPLCMRISDEDGNSEVFEDILIGDVWLIGGQSNAEHHLESCVHLHPGLEFHEDDNFRLFAQTRKFAFEHKELLEIPQRDIINTSWKWKRPDEAASLEFSAMGWFFARQLIGEVGIPQGLIMCCAGGACLRELIPEELAHAMGYFAGANVPVAGYYNTLIHPLLGLNFKGQLFFQGESEGCWRNTAEAYAKDLALAIYDERMRFGFQFPFYNVQLSDYPREGREFFKYADIVRVEQYKAVQQIGNSTLTVDMDIGSHEDTPDWAHSPYKKELGKRLADIVLAREYGIGEETGVSSPVPVKAILTDGGKSVTVRFINTNGTLKTAQEESRIFGFSFGCGDKRIPAEAEIVSGCEVTVKVPDGADICDIGYAFSVTVNENAANLRGGNSLPVPAFCISVDNGSGE